jgi:tight adherence protein B
LGPRGAVLCGVAGAWFAPRIVATRRRRYGHRLDEGAAGAARAIADAMSAGASLRTSVAVAAGRVSGPIAEEVGRTAWELEMGAGTEAALERLRFRSASRAVALIVAAMQVQRRSGGDLAKVLRGVATALEQDWQVIEEANAATAQARFTAMVVVALPVCGIALGTLASPELPARMTGSPVGAGLLIAALALQVAGALLIRRLARSWR